MKVNCKQPHVSIKHVLSLFIADKNYLSCGDTLDFYLRYRGNGEGGGTTGRILHFLLSFVCFSSYQFNNL